MAKELELRVWALADSLRQGNSPSTIPGRGVEVSGVREYQHGDEARGIDWRVTARRGRLFVKEFSQERELPVLVILNLTPSLWSGRGDIKAVRAKEISSLLAAFSLRSGDRVGLFLAGAGAGRFLPPSDGRGQLSRILRELLVDLEWASPLPLGESLLQARFLLHQRARVFLVGDFQWSESETREVSPGLRTLTAKHDLIPVCVMDGREWKLPAVGSILLRDPLTGRRSLFRTSRGNQKLRRTLEQSRSRTLESLRSFGLAPWEVDVEEVLVEALRGHIYRQEARFKKGGMSAPGPERASG
jgi:uncharacterized protein (DUF58 family)